ncbi:Tannase [Drechslerella dactyloides]|uniref:Carboxylic ester hydrolase n=1 Tax=Drechslerella dactyloides TaxID=74499 RepID=A0AAD6ITC8_DREDA|nr:Tannase [Drechslerella dactyloides]
MKFVTIYAASAALISSSSATAIPNDFRARCSGLAREYRPADRSVKVLVSEFMAKGTPFTNPDVHPTCSWTPPKVTVDLCRVRMNVTTSDTSNVYVEAFLPTEWKGKRFLMTGNGGLGGCTAYDSMMFGVESGFATLGHNNGHLGDTAVPFLNRPEIVKDYSYRALLKAISVGKDATSYLYKTDIRKSYYMGCSTGGRQGLKAAQQFPQEFDGIIVGAPANNFNNLMSNQGHQYKIMGKPSDPTYLNDDQWKAVHDSIMKHCDGIDGVLDGVIEDTMKCIPRPEDLLCRPGQTWASDKCLTTTQVGAVRLMYEPFYGKNGTFLYNRLSPGSETEAIRNITSQYIWDWMRYAIYGNPSFSPDDFSVDTADDANRADPFGVSTWEDLTKTKAAGTKVLQYHGLADGAISPESSYRYYEHVSRSMGLPSVDLDKFYRYFPVPGLGHCGGGSGAWYIGNGMRFNDQNPDRPLSQEGGVLTRMVKWVEEGVAPERLTGRSFKDNGKMVEKDHCKWPSQNFYKGGDPDLKESWGCK